VFSTIASYKRQERKGRKEEGREGEKNGRRKERRTVIEILSFLVYILS
jgi:hypothetical protein